MKLLFFLAVLAVFAAPVQADMGYATHLNAGESAYFNQLLFSCQTDAVHVEFPDPLRPLTLAAQRLDGRGLLKSAWADCTLASGEVVRVKAGYRDTPMSYGECGGTPPSGLSVWVAGRQVVAALAFQARCAEPLLKSMTVTAHAADYCVLPAGRDSALVAPEGLDAAGCGHIAVDAGAPIDQSEFPPPGRSASVVDALQLVSSRPETKALCEQLVAANSAFALVVPAPIATPAWRQIADLPRDADGRAWTLAGPVYQATFDLDNSGQVGTVYRQEQASGFFDGTALARAQPDILTRAFDPHEPQAALALGVRVFAYEHVTVVLENGQTYWLLEPAVASADVRVVKPSVSDMAEMCVMRRVAEHF